MPLMREVLRRSAKRLSEADSESKERPTMLVHVVLFRLRPEVEAAEVEACMAGLQALAGVVPEIRSFAVRRDEIADERSATFGIFSTFDDVAALRRYQQHSAHKAAAARPIALSEWVKTWDYLVERHD